MCVCSVAQLWPFQHLFQKLGNNGAWFSRVAGDEHKWIQQKPTNSFSNAKRSLWFSVVQPASPNIMISAARASEPYCRSPDFLSCGMVCTPQSNDEIIGRIQGPKDLFDHVQIDPASLKLPHIIRYDSKTQLLTKLVWFLHNLLELLAQKKAAAVDSSVEGWTYDLWRITLKLRRSSFAKYSVAASLDNIGRLDSSISYCFFAHQSPANFQKISWQGMVINLEGYLL